MRPATLPYLCTCGKAAGRACPAPTSQQDTVLSLTRKGGRGAHAVNQTISAILSSLRTFEPLSDTLDIIIISFVFYQLLQFARKSRAGQLVKGILLIIVSYGLAVMLNLKTVTWLLNNVLTIGFMAAVVIFQPELRRTLERMGQSTMWANRLFGTHRRDPSLRAAWQSAVVAICDAGRAAVRHPHGCPAGAGTQQ